MAGSRYTTKPDQPLATLKTGAKIPTVGLGTWKAARGEVATAVEAALRAGYRHIDCADAYKNHEEVAEGLHKVFNDPDGPNREDVWITSKLFANHMDPQKVKPTCQRVLKELGLNYLDCYLIHWPVNSEQKGGDELSPPYKEVWQAMEKLVDEGLTKHIGVSNLSTKKLADVLSYARIPVSINQIEIHPYWRNTKVVDYAKSQGVHITAYSPLGTPDSAQLMKNEDAPKLLEDPKVVEVAKKYNKTPAQVLIRWAIQHGTSVLPKSKSPERIVANFDVLDWELSADDFKELSSLPRQVRYLRGKEWTKPEGPYKTIEELWDGEV
jgi:diketogulonate reductase-like aldo/keto reductase